MARITVINIIMLQESTPLLLLMDQLRVLMMKQLILSERTSNAQIQTVKIYGLDLEIQKMESL
jgi:hypothetical protein